MRETAFVGLNRPYPGRITNKTNGITFRRWPHQCNTAAPALKKEAPAE
jgi:starch phosphorylase